MARYVPVVLWQPAGASNRYVRQDTVGEFEQGGRGDVDFEGAVLPGGGAELTVDATWRVARGWLCDVAGQRFAVTGVEPVPPTFQRWALTLERSTAKVVEVVELAIGDDLVVVGGDVLTI